MAQTCAQCGMPIRDGYRFCSNCGASAAAASQSPALPGVVEVAEQTALDEQVVAPPTLYGPQTPMPPPSPARNAGPSRAATMRPDPKEGGMYVPYGTEAKTHLESADSPRSRVMPVIVVAAVLLVGLVGLTAFLLTPTEEDRVKQAVYQSNEEQIKAWRDLDVEVLKGTRTGEVLAENIKYVEDLKQKNLYAVPVLGSLEIREVKITGDTATVRTIETWSVTFHNRRDKSVVEAKPLETLAETYHMVKQNGKWMVERLDIGANP